MNIETIKQWLKYDPTSGMFFWVKKPQRGIRAGARAGMRKQDSGYRRVKIEGKWYYEHRLAWLYMTGVIPSLEIDHINGVPDDNRWENLRQATSTINKQNQRRAHINNKSTGILGVYPNKKGFLARITVAKRPKHLGTFKTKKEASAAYIKAKRIHHPGGTL